MPDDNQETVTLKTGSGEMVDVIVPAGMSDAEIKTLVLSKRPDLFSTNAKQPPASDTYVQLPDGGYVQVPPDATPAQLMQLKIKLAGMQAQGTQAPDTKTFGGSLHSYLQGAQGRNSAKRRKFKTPAKSCGGITDGRRLLPMESSAFFGYRDGRGSTSSPEGQLDGGKMSYLVERWTNQLGKDGAEEALRRHPEIVQMSIPEQELLLRSLERLHESRNVPVTVENSEELYRHYFADEAPAEQPFRIPKGRDAEREFLQNATADQLKAYFLAKG